MVRITCSGVLFDVDGVLVNSGAAVERVWSWWAKRHGLDPKEVIPKAHGRPSIETARELLPGADADAENSEIEHREIADVEGVVALPGARELLIALPPERWAIVTSCSRALAQARLHAAGIPYPKNIVTSDDIKYGKPHPEPYLKGASVLGVPPADCIVVEDVPAGIRAGKAAGSRVIAFRTTTRDDNKLKEAGVNWIVKDCTSISLESVRDQILHLLVHDATQVS